MNHFYGHTKRSCSFITQPHQPLRNCSGDLVPNVLAQSHILALSIERSHVRIFLGGIIETGISDRTNLVEASLCGFLGFEVLGAAGA